MQLLKRVVAVEGDTIYHRDNASLAPGSRDVRKLTVVPKGHIWVEVRSRVCLVGVCVRACVRVRARVWVFVCCCTHDSWWPAHLFTYVPCSSGWC
jgi:hypothetical protein